MGECWEDENMNADLSFLYLLYRLSSATSSSRESTLGTARLPFVSSTSPSEMLHTPHVGSGPCLPRPFLVR
jgi:hypothetical protein